MELINPGDVAAVQEGAQKTIAEALEYLGTREPSTQGGAFIQLQLAQAAMVFPAASLGRCGAHGAQLLFEGRSDGLYVSCGNGCSWRLSTQ
jgi:hypothetical protein